MRFHLFRRRAKVLFGAVAILYPLLVFCALVVFRLSIRSLSVFIVVFAAAYVVLNKQRGKGKNTAVLFVTPVILCAIGSICLFTDSRLVLKIYPALADLAYLTFLGASFFIPPPLVYYIFTVFDKTLKDKLPPEQFNAYCRKATAAWCVFFVFDGVIALITVFWLPDMAWGIYNGGITYVLMGLIFVVELVILKRIVKKHAAGT